MARRIVGIDLGTTHTVVAWADPDRAMNPRIFGVAQLVTATSAEMAPLFPSSLYAPLAGELEDDSWGDAPWALGAFAERRGREVPGRLVASAKSWLGHAGVDRLAPILPWGAPDDAADLPRTSPVDAGARVLAHVRRAWNQAFRAHPLEAQEVVLTVPASFDEVARELTVEAARRAGLAVKLLEEPQAAFYDFLSLHGPGALEPLLAGRDEALVLVCDVGGGTTDLSLLRVTRGEGGAGVRATRVAVGNHLLLGGDNMDLALAHLCEPRLATAATGGERPRLGPARFGQLVLACRAAKERLFGDDPPDAATITLLAPGARLVGASRTTELARDEAERVILGGFFPDASPGDRPARARSALVAFGLPYERDVAITRHVASFFARHAPGAAGPDAILLNGGVFRARRLAERLVEVASTWSGRRARLLPNADPDVAVARGAVAFALALRGRGVMIEGGAARGYYVGVRADGGDRRAVCVVPRGSKEGERHVLDGRPLALLVDRPVRFDLYASDDATVHAPGEVVTIDDDRFVPLPPLATVVASRPDAGEPRSRPRGGAEVRVALAGELTAVGTLDLACLEVGVAEPRAFRLAFQLRERPPDDDGPKTEAPALSRRMAGKRLDEAAALVERAFGKSVEGDSTREAKNLVRDLEKLLGERAGWTMDVARALADLLIPSARARRRSADHERVFWQLTGYCLRPGFGHPLDPPRVARLAPLFAERIALAEEIRTYQQFWIAWRRLAGGLEEHLQTAIRDYADPFLAPAEKKLKKPKGAKPQALDLLLELASSLERVPSARRADLGAWILERTWTDRDPRLWAAIGRLGARVPTYASLHHVVAPSVAERWLDHLLREKWEVSPMLPRAAVELARVTDDRARDVSERVRAEVAKKLEAAGARPDWVLAVRELVAVEEADRVAFFGEDLPVGLRLAGG
jgi:molecular chaperone DnaK (HSP70)